jgi:acyl-CoA thioester hydrolase
MHITPIQLRFNDIDMMGHVNNAIIMEYLDLAKSYYFAAAGIPVTPEEGDFTVMIVHHDIDFKRQIHYHDHVEVRTQTTHIGNKSLQLTLQIMANDEVACECRTVMSGYLRSTGTSAPIPEELKTQILRYDATHVSVG